MTTISAAMVKSLREATGAGMMECKQALTEAGGDMDAATDILRKKGAAKAEKRSGRIAAEGVIGFAATADGHTAALVEVNCETDFVAKQDDFQQFANAVAACVLSGAPADLAALGAMPLSGAASVEATRTALIAKIGENISIRRFVRLAASEGIVSHYLHGQRIGVLVELRGGDAELGRDLAMHVAASRPMCVSREQLPAAVLEREREIYTAQAAESGKPAPIIEKMVQGKLNKFVNDITLLGQPFVKDPDSTVADLLKKSAAAVARFERLEVGEGIEKRQDDFAAEVMAQVHGG